MKTMSANSPRLWPWALASMISLGSVLLFLGVYALVASQLALTPDGHWPSFCKWDCAWYGSIAETGYNAAPRPDRSANYGFFPALPIAAAVIMKLSGLAFASAGVIANGLAIFIFSFLVLLNHKSLNLVNTREVLVFLVSFLVSPWSLYDHIPYSEMIFNMAAMGTFVCWRREQYLLAAIFGIVLTATRVTGTFLPIFLCLETLYAERYRLVDFVLSLDRRIFSIAAMPLGLLSFLTYLYFHTGDFFAYFHIQESAWNHAFRNPFGILEAAMAGNGRAIYGLLAYFTVMPALAAGMIWRRIPVVLGAFAMACMTLPVLSMIDGQARYALAIFPVYLLAPSLPRILQYALAAALLAGQFVIIYFWLLESPLLT